MSPPKSANSLAAPIAGNRLLAAILAIRGYSLNNIGLGVTMRASACSLVIAVNVLRARRRHELKSYSQSPGRDLNLIHYACHSAFAVCIWVPEGCHKGEPRNDLVQQL